MHVCIFQVIHVNPGAIVPTMSVTVNIFETLPINKIVVPQLRTNEITDEDSCKLTFDLNPITDQF